MPLDPLNKTNNLSLFNNLANIVNQERNTNFNASNIMDMWVRSYPKG